MNGGGFDGFFAIAMGSSRKPYDYQRRLAGGDQGTECISQLIDIPTGLGKTAAVVLAWLWNRSLPQSTFFAKGPAPRRARDFIYRVGSHMHFSASTEPRIADKSNLPVPLVFLIKDCSCTCKRFLLSSGNGHGREHRKDRDARIYSKFRQPLRGAFTFSPRR